MTTANANPDHRSSGSTPGDTDLGTATQKIKEDAQDVKREIGARAREKAEAGQHGLAHEVDALSGAIDAAASNLDDQDRQGLARYARELSSNLASAAGQLEGRSVDELANDAKRLARNNPALFMLGSIAVGFGLSRFFKASGERHHHDEQSHQGYDTGRADDASPGGMPAPRRDRDMTDTYTTAAAPRSTNGRHMP